MDLSVELSETIKKSNLFIQEEELRDAARGLGAGPRPYVRKYLQNNKFSSLIYMADSSIPDQPDPPGPHVMLYNVRFKCDQGEPRWVQLKFWKRPYKVLDIMQRIEKKHKVPVAMQTLRYKDMDVREDRWVSHVGIEDGDTLEMRYISDKDVEDIWSTYRFFEFIWKHYKNRHGSIWIGLTAEVAFFVTAGLRENLAENLGKRILRPWVTELSEANRDYFERLGGIKMVLNVYELLCLEQWRGVPIHLKLLEAGCLQVLAGMAADELLRNSIIKYDGVGFMMRSFMRVKLTRGAVVRDTSGSAGRPEHNDFLITDLIKACIDFMISFRDRRELHEDVYSRYEVVEQLVNVAHSPSFTIHEAQAAVCVLCNSLRTNVNHRWMTRTSTLEGLCEVVKVRKKMEDGSPKEITVLSYYVQVSFAFVLLTSIEHMSRRVFEKIAHIMEDFLEHTTPEDVIEADRLPPFLIGWSPFLPFMQRLYPPIEHNDKKQSACYSEDELLLLHKLKQLSIESILFAFRVIVEQNRWRSVAKLRDGGLVGYFLSLPTHVPRHLKEKAHLAVKKLLTYSRMESPVPKLEILVRAYLAKNHVGLMKVLERSADDIYVEISPPKTNFDSPRFMNKDSLPIYVMKLS